MKNQCNYKENFTENYSKGVNQLITTSNPRNKVKRRLVDELNSNSDEPSSKAKRNVPNNQKGKSKLLTREPKQLIKAVRNIIICHIG